MKSRWQNQFKLTESASKFHNRVREIFATDQLFSRFCCYQEVPVSDLVPDYPHNNHHFDWYIDELRTIVELHGQQHYKMTNYGNIGYDEAMRQFKNMQIRDETKKQAVLDAGYEYRVVSYKLANKLTPEVLKNIIFNGE